MNAPGRKQYIIKKLQAESYVDTTSLANELGVSTMTIRRDLTALADEGLATLQYGGATLNSGSLFELNMMIKGEHRMAEKVMIAEKCLSYVHDGDSIYLDSGTTVGCLAPLLKQRKNILVMTHSILVMNQLMDADGLDVILCPGEYRFDSFAVMGPLTNEFIAHFKIDTLFLGVEGVDVQHGFTVPNIADGTTKQALVNVAKRVICMADSSKLDTSYLYGIAPLSQAEAIVTDRDAPPELLERYAAQGIPIITA